MLLAKPPVHQAEFEALQLASAGLPQLFLPQSTTKTL
jgi:hypothetical protein